MRKLDLNEVGLGAVIGVAISGVGGLFAIQSVHAIMEGSARVLIETPKVTLLSWLICVPLGWFFGGVVGPRLGERFGSQKAEILAGAIGGLLPVLAIAALGWYIEMNY